MADSLMPRAKPPSPPVGNRVKTTSTEALTKVSSPTIQPSLGLLLKSYFCDFNYQITLQGTSQFNRHMDS